MTTRTRGPRGGGTLYQRTKGRGNGRWYKEIPVGVDPDTGKPKVKSFSGKTQTEAARRARDWQREQGSSVTSNRGMTVMTAVQRLLNSVEHQVKTGAREPNTLENLKYAARRIAHDPIASTSLTKMTSRDVDAAVRRMQMGGWGGLHKISPSYALRVRSVLSRAVKMAMRDGYVSKNVVAESQPVPQLRKQRTALTDAELGAMLDAARARGPQDYALIAVLAGLGGRRGEVCGLRWTEVDFDNQTLAIVAQHKRQKGGTTLGPLKTPAAYRTLPMPSYVFEALNALKEAQEAGEYVFASRTGGAFDPSNLYHRVQSIGVQAGIGKVTPHALRHAMISTLARRGINAQMAQAMAGHADPRMTLGTYTHLATTDLQAAAQALDR